MSRSLLLALLLFALPAFARDWYLFTSFRKNGETGVYLALSPDGKTFTPLKNNEPWLATTEPGMLMRDPWLGKGPDGTWHMLWTWGWTRKEANGALQLGHASSQDLVHWSKPEGVPMMADEPTARNLWAPEAAYDAQRKEWVIFWATTIPGRFPDTENSGDGGYDHRLYSVTTKDWKTFTKPRLYFNPGFNSIDSTVVQVQPSGPKSWVMVFKDERKEPLQKRLRVAWASSPQGPWSEVSEPFSRDWVEGPSVVKIGSEWWIYYDSYRKPQHYGAIKTTDWQHFEDVSEQVQFPADHRHGTVVKIDEATAQRLKSGE